MSETPENSKDPKSVETSLETTDDTFLSDPALLGTDNPSASFHESHESDDDSPSETTEQGEAARQSANASSEENLPTRKNQRSSRRQKASRSDLGQSLKTEASSEEHLSEDELHEIAAGLPVSKTSDDTKRKFNFNTRVSEAVSRSLEAWDLEEKKLSSPPAASQKESEPTEPPQEDQQSFTLSLKDSDHDLEPGDEQTPWDPAPWTAEDSHSIQAQLDRLSRVLAPSPSDDFFPRKEAISPLALGEELSEQDKPGSEPLSPEASLKDEEGSFWLNLAKQKLAPPKDDDNAQNAKTKKRTGASIRKSIQDLVQESPRDLTSAPALQNQEYPEGQARGDTQEVQDLESSRETEMEDDETTSAISISELRTLAYAGDDQEAPENHEEDQSQEEEEEEEKIELASGSPTQEESEILLEPELSENAEESLGTPEVASTEAVILDEQELQSCMETLLFISEKPLSADKLFTLLGENTDRALFDECLSQLMQRYQQIHHGMEIVEVAGGYQFRTKPGRTDLAKKLVKVQAQRLSSGAMETLAIVAYQQPVMKEEVDRVRGVDSSYFVRILLDRKLIKISGRSELPGRPILYSTTSEFLEIFGLKDLSSLPSLRELEQMVPGSETPRPEDEDPRIRDMRKMISEMRLSREAVLYFNPEEDETILKEIKERVTSIPSSTPYLDQLKEAEANALAPDTTPGEAADAAPLLPLEPSAPKRGRRKKWVSHPSESIASAEGIALEEEHPQPTELDQPVHEAAPAAALSDSHDLPVYSHQEPSGQEFQDDQQDTSWNEPESGAEESETCDLMAEFEGEGTTKEALPKFQEESK